MKRPIVLNVWNNIGVRTFARSMKHFITWWTLSWSTSQNLHQNHPCNQWIMIINNMANCPGRLSLSKLILYESNLPRIRNGTFACCIASSINHLVTFSNICWHSIVCLNEIHPIGIGSSFYTIDINIDADLTTQASRGSATMLMTLLSHNIKSQHKEG